MINEKLYEKAINLFKYPEIKKRRWPFIGNYTDMINKYLESNKLSKDQLIRYMLVGFWLNYRVANNSGTPFSTFIDTEHSSINQNEFIDKCKVFNKVYNGSITSTKEYIKLVSIQDKQNVNEHSFFDFVLKGGSIEIHS